MNTTTTIPAHRRVPTHHVSRLRWTGGTALVLAAGVALALLANVLVSVA